MTKECFHFNDVDWGGVRETETGPDRLYGHCNECDNDVICILNGVAIRTDPKDADLSDDKWKMPG